MVSQAAKQIHGRVSRSMYFPETTAMLSCSCAGKTGVENKHDCIPPLLPKSMVCVVYCVDEFCIKPGPTDFASYQSYLV